MTDEKLSGKVGIDTTDFKTNIQGMNRDLRVLESGFRASAASLGDWTKDATGLEMRMKSLSGQMEIQQQKVNATRAEWERIKAEKGETSRAAQDLEIKLNKETETLNKMGVELNETENSLQEVQGSSDEAGVAVETMGEEAEDTGSKFEGLQGVLDGVVGTVQATIGIIAGLAAGVIAVGAAIGGLVFSTAAASAELVDLSAKTGISTTALQEMSYIGDQVGVSLDTITGAQARLVRSMNEGRDGTGQQAEAFEALGVSVTDAQGNLRNTQDVFNETIDALGRIQNPAERDALAMQIFGKSAMELNPLIKAGSEEMARLAEEAHKVGAVMSEEDVAAFEAFDDTLASLQAGLKGTLGTLAAAFLPGFQAVFDQLGGYLVQFSDIVRNSDGDFGKMATGITGLVTQIAQDVASQAPQMMQAGLSIVKSLLDAITQALPAMLQAGIEIIKSLVEFLVQNLPMLLDAGVQILLMLITAIVQNLPMLVEAAMQAIIALANGLTEALPTLIPAIVEAIILIVNTLLENLPMLIDAALMLIIALAQGLIQALPILIAAIPQIVNALLTGILTVLPMILAAGGELIGTLVGGIVASLPVLVVAILQLIEVIISNLAKLPAKAVEAGKNFIKGIITGIENAKGLLFNAISNLVTNMISSLMDAISSLGGGGEGETEAQATRSGLASGGSRMIAEVEQALAELSGRMTIATVGAGTVERAVSSSTANNFDIYGNVIIQGGTTPGSLASALKAKRY